MMFRQSTPPHGTATPDSIRITGRHDVVHVVRMRLDQPFEGASDVLDSKERDRAARFAFDRDRRRYVAAHAWTRLALADVLGCAPESIRFAAGEWGKPRVVDAAQDVRFSLSHAGERGMLAIAMGQEVGIDIEAHRPMQVQELARRFFGVREAEAIVSLPEGEQLTAFFRCWTRKEAFIKALGQGLSFPLSGFEVSVAADHGPQLLRACAAAPDAMDCWRLVALEADEGYSAALAAGSTPWQVCSWDALPDGR